MIVMQARVHLQSAMPCTGCTGFGVLVTNIPDKIFIVDEVVAIYLAVLPNQPLQDTVINLQLGLHQELFKQGDLCLLYTSPSPRD